MNPHDLLRPSGTLREVEPGILSSLANPDGAAYDKFGSAYDWLVGTRLYNALAWGISPDLSRRIASESTDSAGGWHLDAGAGSLAFSATAYAKSARPIIVFDRSLGMLRLAQKRLAGLAGRVPEHVFLVQGDLNDVPFRDGVFASIVSLHVLHHLDDAGAVIRSLDALRMGDATRLTMTSLVAGRRRFSTAYLNSLHRSGVVATPRTAEGLAEIFRSNVRGPVSLSVTGALAIVETALSLGMLPMNRNEA